MIITYKYRIKSLNGLLNKQAMSVNFVWNYCNDRQKDALRFHRPWLSGFDLSYLTAGSSKELGLLANTINAIGNQYAKSRSQHKKPYLKYRGKKSLGWIPIKGIDLKRYGESFRFSGNTFRVFGSRQLPEGKIKDGSSFSQDSRGNWYLNIVIDVELASVKKRDINNSIGIDLGLKEFATLSNGEKIDARNFYRNAQARLAAAQRANKKRQVSAINAKVTNKRKDFHHKLSDRIAKQFDYIAVGNISAAGLAKTKMSKSVLDAGWSSFRTMLAYKSIRNGAWYEEVNESFTTQTCSQCGSIEGPKGLSGLGIREWTCGSCGAVHDRDTNAAMNILRRGRATLAEGEAVISTA